MNNKKNEGNYIVSESEQFSGMVTGNVTLTNGIEFIHRGMICGDVIVQEDAHIYLYGMVNGNVLGTGYVEVWGIVGGTISPDTHSFIHKDAIINGHRQENDKNTI